MKLIMSHILIVLYAVVMLQPIMPQVADFFGHVLNYSDHVRVVHKAKGQLHVHYEYAQAKKDSPGNGTPQSLHQFSASAEHLITPIVTNHPSSSVPQDYFEPRELRLPGQFPETALHPPRL